MDPLTSDENTKQLLDEVEHNMNYQCQGLSYLPKLRAKADNKGMKMIIYDIMQKPNLIIDLLYIFQTICKRGNFALGVPKFENTRWMRGLETGKALNSQL